MNDASIDSTARDLARGLLEVLTPALAPGAPALALVLARDVAQVLSLSGLDRALAALQPHAGHEWPAELRPMIERLTRLAERCREEGDPDVFRRGDLELSALAAELEGLEWSARPNGEQGAVATLALPEVLTDWRLEPAHGVSEVRVTAPVAAALHAALDWLFGARRQRSLAARADDGALELSASAPDPAGFAPAHHMLTFAGGSLFPDPTSDAQGRWTIRVPVYAARETFLMVEHGGFRLALPWHAVQRVQIRRGAHAEETQGTPAPPTLAPLAPLRDGNADRPFALLGLGLKRAWLAADRLIWRLAAEPSAAAGNPPAPGWSSAVRTDEGEIYWFADPALMLREIEAPLPAVALANEMRPAASAPRALAPEAPSIEAPEPEAPHIEAPAPEVEPGIPPAAVPIAETVAERPEPYRESPPRTERRLRSDRRGESRIPLLLAQDVEPLPAEPAREAEGAPSPGAGATPGSTSESGAQRRVLIAEDSIIAQIFLTRTLEHEGLDVFAVTTAAELFDALNQNNWSLVCVDVELPDARGADLLRELLERGPDRERVVALVRDAEDVASARSAGVTRTLYKPFERELVVQMLESLGLIDRSAE